MAFRTARRRRLLHRAFAAGLVTAACAGQIRPTLTPTLRSEALLIRRVGYGRGADLYVPGYISRPT